MAHETQTASDVNTDKFVFKELRYELDGVTHFEWYQDESSVADQVTAGAQDLGPRWLLWQQAATGRIPIFRYRREVESTAVPPTPKTLSNTLYEHAFQLTTSWTAPGYSLDNGGAPVGYATTENLAMLDCLPLLQATGSPERYAYTQSQDELDGWEQHDGMSAAGTLAYSPMLNVVGITADTRTKTLTTVSNDPDPGLAEIGEVNVYKGAGAAIRFETTDGSTFADLEAVQVTYASGPNEGQSAIGGDGPFAYYAEFSPTSIFLLDDNTAPADIEFNYSVTVTKDGIRITDDPKVINRHKAYED